MKAQGSTNKRRPISKLNFKRAPKHTPPSDKDPESALDGHAVGTLVEVEISVIHGGHHGIGTCECIVPGQKKRTP